MNFEKALEKALDGLRTYTPPTVEEQAAALTRRREEMAQIRKTLTTRAEIGAQNAIGKPFAVRVGKHEVNRGTITKVEVAGIRERQNSAIAQYRVFFAMGTLNFPPVIVEALPR